MATDKGFADFLLSIGLSFDQVEKDSKRLEKVVGKQVVGRLRAYFKKLQDQIAMLEKQLGKTHRELSKTRAEVDRAEKSINSMAEKIRKLQKQIDGATGAFDRHGKGLLQNVANAAKWAAIYFVIYRILRGLPSAIQKGTEALEEFDTGMRRTLRLSAATGGEYHKLLKTHIALNNELRKYAYWNGITYQDLQEISYQLKSAGRDVAQIRNQFKALAEFKIIFPEVDVTNLVKMTTGLINVFGQRGVLADFATEGEKLNRILDMLVTLIAEHKVEAEDIPHFMQYAAQAVKAYGGTLEEVIAAQAVFQDNMIKAGIGARGLRQFLDQLAKKYEQIGEIFDIGIDPQKTFYAQMIPFMKALAEKTGDNVEAQSKLAQIFQTRARPMVQLFTSDIKRYIETLEQLVNSEGARARSLKVITQSIAYQRTMLANVWKELTSDILGGPAYLQILKATVGFLRTIHKEFLYIKFQVALIVNDIKELARVLNVLTLGLPKLALKLAWKVMTPPKRLDTKEWGEKLKDVDFETFKEKLAPSSMKFMWSDKELRAWFNYVQKVQKLRNQDVVALTDYTAKTKKQLREQVDALGTYVDEAFEKQKQLIARQGAYQMMSAIGIKKSDIERRRLQDLQAELKLTEDIKERKKLELQILKVKQSIAVELVREEATEKAIVRTVRDSLKLSILRLRGYSDEYIIRTQIKQIQEAINKGDVKSIDLARKKGDLIRLKGQLAIAKEIARERRKELQTAYALQKRQIDYEGRYEMMRLIGKTEKEIAEQRLKDLEIEKNLTKNAEERKNIDLDILRTKQAIVLAIKEEEIAEKRATEERKKRREQADQELMYKTWRLSGKTEKEVLQGTRRYLEFALAAASTEKERKKIREEITEIDDKIAFASLVQEATARRLMHEYQRQKELLSAQEKRQKLILEGTKESVILQTELADLRQELEEYPKQKRYLGGPETEKEKEAIKKRRDLLLAITAKKIELKDATEREKAAEEAFTRTLKEQLLVQGLRNEGWNEEYIIKQQIKAITEALNKEEEVHPLNREEMEKKQRSLENQLFILEKLEKIKKSSWVLYQKEGDNYLKITKSEYALYKERAQRARGVEEEAILLGQLRDIREQIYEYERLGWTQKVKYDELLKQELDLESQISTIRLERGTRVAREIVGGISGYFMAGIKGEYADSTEAGRAFANAVTGVLSDWTEQYLTRALEQALFDAPMMQTMGETIYGAHVRGAEIVGQAITTALSGTGYAEVMQRARWLGTKDKAVPYTYFAEEAERAKDLALPPRPLLTRKDKLWKYGLTKGEAAMMGMSMAVPVGQWLSQGGTASNLLPQMIGAGMGMYGSIGMSALAAGGAFPGGWPIAIAALVTSMVLPAIFGKSGKSRTTYQETITKNTAALKHLSEKADLLSRNLLGLRKTLEPYPFQESFYFAASRNPRMIGSGGINVNVYVDGVEQQGNVTFNVDAMSGYQK